MYVVLLKKEKSNRSCSVSGLRSFFDNMREQPVEMFTFKQDHSLEPAARKTNKLFRSENKHASLA